MILIGRTPCLRVNNYLHSLTVVVNGSVNVGITVEQFLQKKKLITSVHENVLFNVE